MSDSLAGVNQMVSDLTSSISAAVKRIQDQSEAAAPQNVKEFQKEIRKSSGTSSAFATDIGILARGTTRLNVVSNLAAKDTVDFYKFKVTSKGEATLGQLGDEGVRVQLQTKLGVVIADSSKDAGGNYDNYLRLASGQLELDRGDYTLRITRDKGVDVKEDKNYALQLSMGSYSQDYDTVAKQPKAGDSPFQLSAAQQSMLDGLNNAAANLRSIPFGQTGTQKLLGSVFSGLF